MDNEKPDIRTRDAARETSGPESIVERRVRREPSRLPFGGETVLAGRGWKLVFVIAAGIVLGLGGLQLLYIIAQPLALLILAISIAAAAAPLVERLEYRLPRNVAIVLVYLFILLILAGIGQLIVPTLAAEAQRIGTRAPDLMKEAQNRLALLGWTGFNLATLATQLAQLSSSLVSLPLMVFSSLLQISLVLVMSIYWLIVGRGMRDFFLSLFPQEASGELAAGLKDIASAMGGYIRATLINGLVIGSLTAIGLSIIGVSFPLVLGVLAGLLELIPILGPIIAGILVVLVALLSSTTTALIAIVFMFLLQQFEGNILVPNIMRSQTDISPLLVILALIAGDTIGGLLGALVAIPVASTMQVVFVRLIVPSIRRQTGADSGAEDQ